MREDIRQHLLYLVNRFRSEHGRTHEEKAPLRLDERHSAFAKQHSEHVIGNTDKGQHTYPPFLEGRTENTGYAEGHWHPYQIAEGIFQSWVASTEGHRENMLKARREVGIDIAHRQHNGFRRVHMTGRFR